MKLSKFSPRSLLAQAALVAGVAVSGQAFAQYSATESFDGPGLSCGADGWIAQYKNAGGNYNDGDVGGCAGAENDFKRYDAAITPPPGIPFFKNGNYLNFYARYDDAGIRETFLARNMGGFAGTDPYTANNGDYTLTACYFLNTVANGGADLANGVSAGLALRYSGLYYGSWPGDAPSSAQAKAQIPPGAATGVWTRLSLNVTLTDAARVDAGVWVTNPVLSAPYISTGVLWDDFYFGLAANAPTTACAGGSTTSLGPPSDIPTLPLGGLLGLVGLIGWLGLRKKA